MQPLNGTHNGVIPDTVHYEGGGVNFTFYIMGHNERRNGNRDYLDYALHQRTVA